jgi:phosphoenolpyruvate carboxylase
VVARTQGPEDVLAPLVLARWAGVDDRRSGQIGLDFAPLFESGDSLRSAGRTMHGLLANPDYRAHLAARDVPQPLLVGYSQASRDSGYMGMRLAVYDAQRDLTQSLAAAGQPAVIYHARGGSVARGGIRLDELIRAAPPDTVDGTLRVTEQGETLSQSYGLKSNALRTLERACGTLAIATQAHRQGTARPETTTQHELVTRLTTQSRAAWRALVIDERDFQDFFRSVTPIDVIDRMQIGSRSIWEVVGTDLGERRVRSTPWMFAWSQTRYFMPGWYGSGVALHAAIAAGELDALRETYESWRFFTSVIDDLESQLARTDLDIAEQYVQLVSPGLQRFAPLLRDEYLQCRDAVLAIKGSTELFDSDRTQQRAIQLRNPYVDPMNLMQIDLLRRWRATAREDEDLFQALLASVSGIAQGLQTTG